MQTACPICGEIVEVAQDVPGIIGRCGSCKQFYEIDSDKKLRALGDRGDEDTAEVKHSGGSGKTGYKCGACGARIEPPAGWEGTALTCPSCGVKLAGTASRAQKTAAHDPASAVEPAPGEGRGVRAAAGGASAGPQPLPSLGEARAESDWFFMSGIQQEGPVPVSMIEDLIRRGELRSSSRVWRPGLDEWVELGLVPEFYSILNPASGQTRPTPKGAAPTPQYEGDTSLDQLTVAGGIRRNWVIVGGGAAVVLGFFLPWAGLGPIKVSGMDLVNLAVEADKPGLAIFLSMIPILGALAAIAEAAAGERQRIWAAVCGGGALLVFVGLLLWAADSSSEMLKEFPTRIGNLLRYILQIGTLMTVGGCLAVLFACVSFFSSGTRKAERQRTASRRRSTRQLF